MQHVVFDFDGTLVDSLGTTVSVFNRMAAKHGFKHMETADVEAVRRMTGAERIAFMQVPLYRLPTLALEFGRNYRDAIGSLAFFDGITDVLRRLREQRHPLHIISSNTEENIRAFLDRQDMPVFDSIYAARNIFGKHRVIAKFLKHHRLTPGDVLYVGDEERDIIACHKVGVRVAAVTWGYDAPDVLKAAGPDHLIERPQDLVALVESPIAH
jgi:phosphoglycolate phosphatase